MDLTHVILDGIRFHGNYLALIVGIGGFGNVIKVVISVAIALKFEFGFHGNPGHLEMWYSVLVMVVICIYIASFAWSWGPLGWLVPSEIFPLEIRSAAQSVNVSVNMIFTFFIAQICYREEG